jgi:hypothetical protein
MTMQNALTKHTWSYIRPGSPGVPATPGRPASPARTVVETVVLDVWELRLRAH